MNLNELRAQRAMERNMEKEQLGNISHSICFLLIIFLFLLKYHPEIMKNGPTSCTKSHLPSLVLKTRLNALNEGAIEQWANGAERSNPFKAVDVQLEMCGCAQSDFNTHSIVRQRRFPKSCFTVTWTSTLMEVDWWKRNLFEKNILNEIRTRQILMSAVVITHLCHHWLGLQMEDRKREKAYRDGSEIAMLGNLRQSSPRLI